MDERVCLSVSWELLVSVRLFRSCLIGRLTDLAWIFASSLIAICLKCRSKGRNLAATSTVTVPAVPGSPKHKHTALRWIEDILFTCLLPCHMLALYSIIGRRRKSVFVDTLSIPLTSLMTLRALLTLLVTFCMCGSNVSCSSRVIPRIFGEIHDNHSSLLVITIPPTTIAR